MIPVRTIHFLTQGGLHSISGGYIYNRKLVNALKQHGFKIVVHNINSTPVMQHVLAQLNPGACVIVDSIIAEYFAGTHKPLRQSLRVVYLCHLPMSLRPELTDAECHRLSLLEQNIVGHTHLVLCTSMFTKNRLIIYNSNVRYLVILPAVHPRFIPPTHKNKNTNVCLLCVANILPAKGQLAVIRSLHAIASNSWRLRLIAGSDVCDENYLNQIQTTIRDNQLENQVSLRFDCARPDLLHEYQQADAFVLATHFETYGMALAEARACALPTIVNDVGGVRESTHALSTIYVNPNTTQDLQQALHRLITNRDYLLTMRNYALCGLKQQQSDNASCLDSNAANNWDTGIKHLCKALIC